MTSSIFTIPLVCTEGACSPLSEGGSPLGAPRHFIAGPENAMLRVLVDLISAKPTQFDLVVLYGPTGVGKSHLLHGIVERQRRLSGGSRVVYGSGADFARAFARAVDVDSVNEWRDKQRSCDLFVMDDLQELATKPAAQQELVQTLDVLAEREIQTVLACRHSIAEWNWMLPQLHSRVQGGLPIPLVAPSAETANFIAGKLSASIVDLNGQPAVAPTYRSGTTYSRIRSGALQSIHGNASQKKSAANKRKGTTDPDSLAKMLPMIAKSVAKHFHLRTADLLGPSRRKTIVHARGVAMYSARKLLNLSFDEIGRYFGGRDHTTVLHSWRKTEKLLDTSVALKHEIDQLLATLNNNFEIQRASQ